MRVLLVNSFYAPNLVGGAEHSVKILAEALAGAGHEVAVFTFDLGRRGLEVASQSGVTVFRSGAPWFGADLYLRGGSRVRKAAAFVLGLRANASLATFRDVVRQFRPSVVNTHSLYGISTGVWRVADECGIPVVHTMRDYALIDPRGVIGLTPLPMRLSHERQMINRVEAHVRIVTAPSQALIEFHRSHGFFERTPAVRVVNCVHWDQVQVQALAKEREARAGSPLRFVFAGNLAEYKGLGVLLEAMEKLRGEKVELHICGRGPMEDRVKSVASVDRRVVFHGLLSPDELAKLMRASQVLVAPSQWEEPFGRVVIEAFANAMAVVGSESGGIGEILASSGGGVTVTATSAASVAAGMRTLLAPTVLAECVRRAVSALPRYSPDEQRRAYERVYGDAIAGG